MATQWITGMITNAVSGPIHSAVSTSGEYAGDMVNGVGNGINGVGEGINGAIRKYGNGTKDYGNAIKDWSGAPGPRVSSATNPLGLTDTKAGAKRQFQNPKRNYDIPRTKALPSGTPNPRPKIVPATIAGAQPNGPNRSKSFPPAAKKPIGGPVNRSGGGANKVPPSNRSSSAGGGGKNGNSAGGGGKYTPGVVTGGNKSKPQSAGAKSGAKPGAKPPVKQDGKSSAKTTPGNPLGLGFKEY